MKIDDVLATSNVVGGVVEMGDIVRIDGIVPYINVGSVIIGEFKSVWNSVREAKAFKEVVLKVLAEELWTDS